MYQGATAGAPEGTTPREAGVSRVAGAGAGGLSRQDLPVSQQKSAPMAERSRARAGADLSLVNVE